MNEPSELSTTLPCVGPGVRRIAVSVCPTECVGSFKKLHEQLYAGDPEQVGVRDPGLLQIPSGPHTLVVPSQGPVGAMGQTLKLGVVASRSASLPVPSITPFAVVTTRGAGVLPAQVVA